MCDIFPFFIKTRNMIHLENSDVLVVNHNLMVNLCPINYSVILETQ
jgi:hypothetical protein